MTNVLVRLLAANTIDGEHLVGVIQLEANDVAETEGRKSKNNL